MSNHDLLNRDLILLRIKDKGNEQERLLLSFFCFIYYMCLDTCNEWLYNVAHAESCEKRYTDGISERYDTRGKEDEGIL